jgi:hypothetical protein
MTLTRSMKVGARGRPAQQLPLTSAPKLDAYGLHSDDCECGRCALGYRPSMRDRHLARAAAEERERRRKQQEAKDAAATRDAAKHLATWQRLEAQVRVTKDEIKRMTAPVQRRATDQELDELKREFGFRPRRKDRP